MTQKIKCPHCGEEIWSGNFCATCGGKLVKVCDCAFLGKPFDCGYDKCPGFKIYRLVALAQEKPPEGGKEHVSPDSYKEHPHAWNPNSWSTDNT